MAAHEETRLTDDSHVLAARIATDLKTVAAEIELLKQALEEVRSDVSELVVLLDEVRTRVEPPTTRLVRHRAAVTRRETRSGSR
jgi:hypothetical protein